MSLKLADHKLKGRELRKVSDEMANYDELLAKFYAPAAWSASGSILPARKKGKLVAEAKAANGRLVRSRQVLIDLLKRCPTESADWHELKESKDKIEERMSRHYQLDVDVKKSPGANAVLKAGVALSDEERACADAIAFLTGAMTTLRRQIERAEAAVERTVVAELDSTRNGASAERDETVVKLLEMTDEREWVVDRLEKVERMLVNDEVPATQVMSLEGGVRNILEAADDAEVRADRKMFNAFGLDIATKKVIEPTRLVKRSPTHALDPSRDARTGSGDSETSSGGWGSLEIDDGGSSSSAIQMDEVIPGYKLVGPGKSLSVVECPRPLNYQTLRCKYGSACTWGDKCNYRHDDDKPTPKPASSPTAGRSPCVYFMTGRCLKGNACDFQHGVAPMAKTAEAARSIPTHADFPALPVEDGAESSFSTLGRWAAEGCTAKARAPTASLNKENRSRPYNYQTVLCTKFSRPGGCHKDDARPFAHGHSDLRIGPWDFGTRAASDSGIPFSVNVDDQPHAVPIESSRPTSPSVYMTPPSSVASSTVSPPVVLLDEQLSLAGDTSKRQASTPIAAATALSDPAPSTTAPAGSPSSSACSPQSTTARPVLLPLGLGACATFFLRGRCANEDCLHRHTLDDSDYAVGVRYQLGPGACLNRFKRGYCGNGDDCLSRHVLTEADYAIGASLTKTHWITWISSVSFVVALAFIIAQVISWRENG